MLDGEFGNALLEYLAALNRAALRRGEGAQLTPAGTAADICGGLLERGASRSALDPDLPPEKLPVKEQRCVWIGLQILALAAFVVRVEHESALVVVLYQHHPNR